MSLDPATVKELHADRRRATAALLHYAEDNYPGIQAIVAEAKEADRVGPLFLMLLDLFTTFMPGIEEEQGKKMLREYLLVLARGEHE